MECRDLVEAVTAYLDGAMSPEDRARFDEHLALCDGCTNYLAQIRETIRLTGSVDPDVLPNEQRTALQGVFSAWASEG
ncbi:MAG: zf-HC2 domain-containing protein [Actinomycetota bacterium]